jgi:hypothetical protein
MTSGERTQINSKGFIMAGIIDYFDPAWNTFIVVDKTDAGGTFPSSGTNFKVYYSLNATNNNACTAGYNVINTNAGASIIECNQGINGEWYALVGSYDFGCFFSTLSSIGNTITTVFYPFPYAHGAVNQKPHIVEGSTPGNFFIAGRFDTSMYVMKVNLTGGVIWSKFYHAGGPDFEPRDMIISGNNGDLVIVGHLSPDPQFGRVSDGFFISLNPATGGVNAFKDYSGSPCNWFNSVENAYCTDGGVGYILGGYTDPSLTMFGGALMTKLDLSGNIIWNTVITGGTPSNGTRDIMGVVERLNTSSSYEYYGLAQTYDQTNGFNDMAVFKLDNAGNPASGVNEYHYSATSISQFTAVNLSYKNNITPNSDVGLHVYASNSQNHFLLESYFNGITGCSNESFTNIFYTETGPTDINPWIGTYGSLSPCADFDMFKNTNIYTVNTICSNNSVSGGSNLRPITGMSSFSKTSEQGIYPNPGSGKYTVEAVGNSNLTIYNFLGEKVFQKELISGSNQINIENLENGLYTVSISNLNGTKNFQVIKN